MAQMAEIFFKQIDKCGKSRLSGIVADDSYTSKSTTTHWLLAICSDISIFQEIKLSSILNQATLLFKIT